MGVSLPLGRKRQARYEDTEDEEDADESGHEIKPLPTDFCEWCCTYFANPLTKVRNQSMLIEIMIVCH